MAKRKEKTKAELQAELRTLKNIRRGDVSAAMFNTLCRSITICFVAWCVYLSIDSLSGKLTIADIAVSVLANVKISVLLSGVFGTGGIAYGWRQRALRKKSIARLEKRNSKWERKKDPNRTSSGLTPAGGTHPQDK